jgi:hypothetical protein
MGRGGSCLIPPVHQVLEPQPAFLCPLSGILPRCSAPSNHPELRSGLRIGKDKFCISILCTQQRPRRGIHASVHNRRGNRRDRSLDLGRPGFGRTQRRRPNQTEWPMLEVVKGVRPDVWSLARVRREGQPTRRRRPSARPDRTSVSRDSRGSKSRSQQRSVLIGRLPLIARRPHTPLWGLRHAQESATAR